MQCYAFQVSLGALCVPKAKAVSLAAEKWWLCICAADSEKRWATQTWRVPVPVYFLKSD